MSDTQTFLFYYIMHNIIVPQPHIKLTAEKLCCEAVQDVQNIKQSNNHSISRLLT